MTSIAIRLAVTGRRKALGVDVASDFILTLYPVTADAPIGTVVGVLTEVSGGTRPADFALSLNPVTADAPVGTVVGTLG